MKKKVRIIFLVFLKKVVQVLFIIFVYCGFQKAKGKSTKVRLTLYVHLTTLILIYEREMGKKVLVFSETLGALPNNYKRIAKIANPRE